MEWERKEFDMFGELIFEGEYLNLEKNLKNIQLNFNIWITENLVKDF